MSFSFGFVMFPTYSISCLIYSCLYALCKAWSVIMLIICSALFRQLQLTYRENLISCFVSQLREKGKRSIQTFCLSKYPQFQVKRTLITQTKCNCQAIFGLANTFYLSTLNEVYQNLFTEGYFSDCFLIDWPNG